MRARAWRVHDFARAAWLCSIPVASIVVAVAYLLGPSLGHLLPQSGEYTFLQIFADLVHPERTEQARYAVAVCAPPLLALTVASAPRWLSRVPQRFLTFAVVLPQLLLVAVVAASFVAQRRYSFGSIYTHDLVEPFHQRYFTTATLVVAVLLAAAVAGGLRSERLRRRVVGALREKPGRRALFVGGLAAAATVVWMLHAVHSDAEVGDAPTGMLYHLGFTLDETFAVLNGRTPLVDFTSQYGSLWPFVIAVPMRAFGASVLTFTIVLSALTALALVCVYGVLRRAAGSSTAGLLLYLPFLALSLFQIGGTLQNRSTTGSYYGNFPLRYAIPFFLAWLTSRAIERDRWQMREVGLLFCVAGLAVLNNGDFGIAALAGTVAALGWSASHWERRRSSRVVAAAAAGLAAALALVVAVTLVRAGALPQLSRLVDYARLYAVGGFSMMPLPGILGVHLLIYLTYAAAIVVATVRRLRGASNRVLTGMLAWAGVFGLGAGVYYMGRSHPLALIYEFSAWAFALALLSVVAFVELARPRLRLVAIGAFVVLFGSGVMVCALAQTPTPWGQVERLSAAFAPTDAVPDPEPLAPSRDPEVRHFVASLADGPDRFVYKRGAPVAILLTTGHRIADAYGVVDISPYTGVESLETVQRVETVLDALRDAGGNTVVLPDRLDPGIFAVLARRGFEPLTAKGLQPYRPAVGRFEVPPTEQLWPEGSVMKWVDTRHLHARALG